MFLRGSVLLSRLLLSALARKYENLHVMTRQLGELAMLAIACKWHFTNYDRFAYALKVMYILLKYLKTVSGIFRPAAPGSAQQLRRAIH
jgi:hypothetical protein